MGDRNKSTRNSVRVVCRIRPESESEKQRGSSCVRVQNDTVTVQVDDGTSSFTFDRAFGPEADQAQVFESVALPMVEDVLQGYNATVFAYGQTASGKTFTMEGPDHRHPVLRGIIPRAVDALFEGVANADETIEFTVKVAYIEIYLERIRDLLDEHGIKVNLQVREDQMGVYVAGVTEEYVTNQDELYEIMAMGSQNRAIAATGMNEGSSRSHSVFTVTVTQRNHSTNTTKMGKLVLVDLAGSEMVRKTGASGQQLEEAKTINKSLSALGQVINALTDEKSKHIPYRDSKLTRVLQDSLGGNSKTALIINCSPSSFNAPESISTLRFGSRAKNIKNQAVVNETRSVEELQAMLMKAERTIDLQQNNILALEAQLKQLGGSDAHRAEADESAARALAQLQETVTRLEQELDEEREESTRGHEQVEQFSNLVRDKESLLEHLSGTLDDVQRQNDTYRSRVEQLQLEKDSVIVTLHSEQALLADERERFNFELQELRLTVEKLQQDRDRLSAELEESSSERARANTEEQRPFSPESFTPPRVPSIDRSVSYEMNPLANVDDFVTNQYAELGRFLQAHPTDPAIAESYSNMYKDLVDQVRQVETQKHDMRRKLQLAQEMHDKRTTELDRQRARLVADLEDKVAKVVELEAQLAAVQSGTAPPQDPAQLEKSHQRSLEQRLAQLVAVHRQLLRKHGSLEIENAEYRKKIHLRDERLQQLDQQIRSMNANMRMQAERHVQEVAAFKERLDAMKQVYTTGAEPGNGVLAAGSHVVHHGEVRSIRGGGQEVKSIRGGRTMSSKDLLGPMRTRPSYSHMSSK